MEDAGLCISPYRCKKFDVSLAGIKRETVVAYFRYNLKTAEMRQHFLIENSKAFILRKNRLLLVGKRPFPSIHLGNKILGICLRLYEGELS